MPAPLLCASASADSSYALLYTPEHGLYATTAQGVNAAFVSVQETAGFAIKQLIACSFFYVILTETGEAHIKARPNEQGQVYPLARIFQTVPQDAGLGIKIIRRTKIFDSSEYLYLLTATNRWFKQIVTKESEGRIIFTNVVEVTLHQELELIIEPGEQIQEVFFAKRIEFILTNQRLLAKGGNVYGALGINTDKWSRSTWTPIPELPVALANIKHIFPHSKYTALLTINGELYVSGSNYDGVMGLAQWRGSKKFIRVAEDKGRIQKVASSSTHMVILTDQGLFATGDNTHGELGLGDNETRYGFERIVNPAIFTQPISAEKCQIVAGNHYTAIYLAPGIVFSCGKNNKGQLGYGSTSKNYTELASGYFFSYMIANKYNVSTLIPAICSFQQKIIDFYRLFNAKHPVKEADCAALIEQCLALIARAVKEGGYQLSNLNAILWLLSFIWCTARIENKVQRALFFGKVKILDNMKSILSKKTQLTPEEIQYWLQHICFLKYNYYKKVLNSKIGANILPSLDSYVYIKRLDFSTAGVKKPIILSTQPVIVLSPTDKQSQSYSVDYASILPMELLLDIFSYLTTPDLEEVGILSAKFAAAAARVQRSRLLLMPQISPNIEWNHNGLMKLLDDPTPFATPAQQACLEILRAAVLAGQLSIVCVYEILQQIKQTNAAFPGLG